MVDKARRITNNDKILVLSLFGIKPELRSLYLEQLKRGIEDYEKSLTRANYQ